MIIPTKALLKFVQHSKELNIYLLFNQSRGSVALMDSTHTMIAIEAL
jgi:hypothetical protein